MKITYWISYVLDYTKAILGIHKTIPSYDTQEPKQLGFSVVD